MNKEQKDLLLKDLCARLPYEVKIQNPNKYGGYTSVIESVDIDGYISDSEGNIFEVDIVKPYLFPLSSMTDEQKEEYDRLCYYVPSPHYEFVDMMTDAIDYLIENHFDYHGLIPMGLALDATGLNIY